MMANIAPQNAYSSETGFLQQPQPDFKLEAKIEAGAKEYRAGVSLWSGTTRCGAAAEDPFVVVEVDGNFDVRCAVSDLFCKSFTLKVSSPPGLPPIEVKTTFFLHPRGEAVFSRQSLFDLAVREISRYKVQG